MRQPGQNDDDAKAESLLEVATDILVDGNPSSDEEPVAPSR